MAFTKYLYTGIIEPIAPDTACQQRLPFQQARLPGQLLHHIAGVLAWLVILQSTPPAVLEAGSAN